MFPFSRVALPCTLNDTYTQETEGQLLKDSLDGV